MTAWSDLWQLWMGHLIMTMIMTSGDWDGHCRTFTFFCCGYWQVNSALCFGSLSCWNVQEHLMRSFWADECKFPPVFSNKMLHSSCHEFWPFWDTHNHFFTSPICQLLHQVICGFLFASEKSFLWLGFNRIPNFPLRISADWHSWLLGYIFISLRSFDNTFAFLWLGIQHQHWMNNVRHLETFVCDNQSVCYRAKTSSVCNFWSGSFGHYFKLSVWWKG